MKTIFLYLFLLVFLIHPALSQQGLILSPFAINTKGMSVVDSCNTRIWYAFNADDINNLNTYFDLQRLEIGEKRSKYYSDFTFNSDSLCTVLLNAQIPAIPLPKDVKDMTVVDSGYIRIWYALNATEISETKTYDDLQRLDIGTNLSKYYSFFVYNSDSLVTEWNKLHRGERSGPSQLGVQGKKSDHWNEYHYSEYFKNISSNTLTEYSRMPGYLYKANCQYTEDMSLFNWNICKDTVMILGHCSQKATCTFRGREYTAWFSMNIPISNGPWKFGGLPGLILRVADKDNLFVFECVGIEYMKDKFSIKIYNDYKKYKKVERKEVLKFQKKVNESFMKIAGLVLRNGSLPSKQRRYFIELE